MPDLLTPDGTRLALHDLGGAGRPVLLLPGLCGHAGVWSATAAWLRATHHVHALDPRGHGASERRPTDVSRDSHVADVAAALAVTGPAVLVGQSLGGHTAFPVAARQPGLVTRLVLAEAGPQGPDADTPARIARWLDGWPTPFPDRTATVRHFGGGRAGEAWADGLRTAPGRRTALSRPTVPTNHMLVR
ncbi:alpha/beta hydrolase [Plantactinospora sp. KLBMP9567]|uniref:alpha/beta fold hydrolase n=1 Tax=Plantactinospora sp. KLBMP9567 TaxID=3085900 RepID=UPI0029822418|nr:alpha/beta hydrolase [Plantactinospora sp. KLBMP9567]MDW5327499.1 alpha/beta hydrolase [Plantactinospora sp. KLBMP9567]